MVYTVSGRDLPEEGSIKRQVNMSIDEQVRIMEGQINGPAGFTLIEKLYYLKTFFDPEYTKEAMDIVRHNLVRSLK